MVVGSVLLLHVTIKSLCACIDPPCLAKRAVQDKFTRTHLFGAAFKHNILLALVQPPLPHGPEVKHSVFPLQQLIQDVWPKNSNTIRNRGDTVQSLIF